MIQNAIIETAQAMNAMQLSMSYSIGVTKMSMEAQETAAQALTQMLPTVPLGQYIDTYA